MTLEIEFAGSEIEDIVIGPKELEIRFSAMILVSQGSSESERREVPGSVKIVSPKYKTLPKKGVISDGELYGIAGKALNGRLPINFRSERSIELMLADEKGEHSIHGKGIEIVLVRLELN